METDTKTFAPPVPLSAEEESAWSLLVEEGQRLRAGRSSLVHEKSPDWVKRMSKKDILKVVPVPVKRWVVMRAAGMKFSEASSGSGATWLQIQDARYHSEEMRCAMDAMDERSRQLMREKAKSVVEQSQEEGARVSLAQTQVSMKILSSLDREHFGEQRGVASEEVQKAIGGGGFVINLIGDAAKVAEAVPSKRPGKALVFTDV